MQKLPTLCSENHCGECYKTLSRALEAFYDPRSPATVAIQVPSFPCGEFPYVLLGAHSWKRFRIPSCELRSCSYCAVEPSLTCLNY